MRILATAAVENQDNLFAQLMKQTYKDFDIDIYTDPIPASGINNRRIRIAENQQILKEKVISGDKYDLIWQLEGDCELPEDCLERLLDSYHKLKGNDFGYISGVQVGRHGLYCIGAWIIEDENNFHSIEHTKKGIQEVDATGFYCLLAPTDVWLTGVAKWKNQPYGPDVVWGLSIDKKKFVDMDLHIGHHHNNGIIPVDGLSTCTAYFYKKSKKWEYRTKL